MSKLRQPTTTKSSSSSPAPAYGFKVGDRVTVNDGEKAGVCRFIGKIKGKDGDWAGVELDEPTGKNDGSVGPDKYFECKPNHGLFLVPAKVALDKAAASSSAASSSSSSPQVEPQATPSKVPVKSGIPVLSSTPIKQPARPVAAATPPPAADKGSKTPENLQKIAKDLEVFEDQEVISRSELEALAGVTPSPKPANDDAAAAGEILALQRDLEQARKALAESESAKALILQEKQDEAEKLRQSLSVAQEDLRRLEGSEAETKQSADRLTQEKAALEAELGTLRENRASSASDSEAALLKLESSMGQASHRITELEGLLGEAKKAVSDGEQERAALQVKQQEGSAKIAGLEAQILEHTSLATKGGLETSLLSAQITTLQANLNEKERLLKSQQETEEKLRQDLEAHMAKASTAIADLEAQKGQVEGQLQKSEAEKLEVTKERDVAVNQLQQATLLASQGGEEAAVLSAQIVALQTQAAEKAEIEEKLRQDLEAQKGQLQKSEAEKLEATKERDAAATQLQQAIFLASQGGEESAVLSAQIVALQTQVAEKAEIEDKLKQDLEVERAQTKTKDGELAATLKTLEEKNLALQEISASKSHAEATWKELEEAQKEKHSLVVQERDGLKEKIATLTSGAEDQKNQATALQASLADGAVALAASQKALAEARGQYEELNTRYEAQLSGQSSERGDLERRLQELTTELNKAKVQKTELEDRATQLETLRDRAETSAKDLGGQLQSKTAEIDSLQQQLEASLAKCQEEAKELEEERRQGASKAEEISSLQAKVQELATKAGDQGAEAERLRGDLQAKDQLEAALEKLRTESTEALKLKDRENQELKGKIEVQGGEAARVELELASLRQRLQAAEESGSEQRASWAQKESEWQAAVLASQVKSTGEHEGLTRQIESLQSQLTEASALNQSRLAEIDSVKQASAAREAEAKAAQGDTQSKAAEDLKALQINLEAKITELKVAEEEARKLQEKNLELTRQVEAQHQTQANAEGSHSAEVSDLKQRLEASQNELKISEGRGDTLKQREEDLRKLEQALGEVRQELLDQKSGRKSQEEGHQGEVANLKALITELQAEVEEAENLRAQKAELSKELEKNEETMDMLKKQLKELEQAPKPAAKNLQPELDNAKETILELRNRISTLEQKAATASTTPDASSSQMELEFQRSVIADLQRKVGTKEKELAELKDKYQDLLSGASIVPAAKAAPEKAKLPDRPFCSICEDFSHATEDCPKASNEDYLEKMRAKDRNKKTPEARQFCEICEQFGHSAEACDSVGDAF